MNPPRVGQWCLERAVPGKWWQVEWVHGNRVGLKRIGGMLRRFYLDSTTEVPVVQFHALFELESD